MSFNFFFDFLYFFFSRGRHEAVVRALARKRRGMTRSALLTAASLDSGGAATKVLDELEESGFILQMPRLGRAKRDAVYWLADEYSRGTWAIHRPGWYTRHHAEMQRPEGRVLLAGSDLANGWAGFIDGAIESGLTAGVRVEQLLD